MSLTKTQSPASVRILKSPAARNVWKATKTLFAVLVLGLGYWALEHWLQHGGSAPHAPSEAAEHAPDAPRTEVLLSPEKLARIPLEQSICSLRPLRPVLSVPARLEYEPKRRLELKAPTAIIVRKIYVQRGAVVAAGDPLIQIDSEDIGLARAELRNLRRQEGLRESELARAREIEQTVSSLEQEFAAGKPVAEIEEKFRDRPMGTHREVLFRACSQYQLARQLIDNIKDMETSGALSTRLILERKSQWEVAEATFRTAQEQALYEARKTSREAAAALQYARDLSAVTARKLSVLAGNFSLPPSELETSAELTQMTLRAPFAGLVAEAFVQEGGRVNHQEPMFLLGDTSQLWVSAEIRENQWKALRIDKGEQLRLTTPALPNQKFTCTMEFVSADVSPETRSVPMIALLDNRDGHLKPGMLVWVEIPAGDQPSLLTVPHEALQTHENQKFVFVPEGKDRFLRRDVTVGREDGTYSEITAGLAEGTPVVTTGSFTLKSELLLENEE